MTTVNVSKEPAAFPLLTITSQKTIILNDLHTKVWGSESSDCKQCYDMMPCSLIEGYNILKQPAASVF